MIQLSRTISATVAVKNHIIIIRIKMLSTTASLPSSANIASGGNIRCVRSDVSAARGYGIAIVVAEIDTAIIEA